MAVRPSSAVAPAPRGQRVVTEPSVTPAAALLEAVIEATVDAMRYPQTHRMLSEGYRTANATPMLDRVIRATETRELARQLSRRVVSQGVQGAQAGLRASPALARLVTPAGLVTAAATAVLGYGQDQAGRLMQRMLRQTIGQPDAWAQDEWMVLTSTQWTYGPDWFATLGPGATDQLTWKIPASIAGGHHAAVGFSLGVGTYPWIPDPNGMLVTPENYNNGQAYGPYIDPPGQRLVTAAFTWFGSGTPGPGDAPSPPGTTTVVKEDRRRFRFFPPGTPRSVSRETPQAAPELATKTWPVMQRTPGEKPKVNTFRQRLRPRLRPPRYAMEKKMRASNYHRNSLVKAMENATEGLDILKAIYEALPADLRRSIRDHWVAGEFAAGVRRPAKDPPPWVMAEALLHHWQEIDVVQAFRNLAWETISDAIYAGTGAVQANAWNNFQRRSGVSGGAEMFNRAGEEDGGAVRNQNDMTESFDPFRISPPQEWMRWLQGIVKGT